MGRLCAVYLGKPLASSLLFGATPCSLSGCAFAFKHGFCLLFWWSTHKSFNWEEREGREWRWEMEWMNEWENELTGGGSFLGLCLSSRLWVFLQIVCKLFGIVRWAWEYKRFYEDSTCAKSCPTLWNPMDCSPPGSSVPGILQARILEWVAMPSSRRSPWPRDQACTFCISCIGRWVLYH